MIKPIDSGRISRSKWGNMAKLIEAQARHETGNYTSDLYKRANNLFGMRVAVKRPFVRIGTDNNYSVYESTDQSIQDFILWLEYTNFPTNIQNPVDYVDQLFIRGYFTDNWNNYAKGLIFHYNQIT